MNTRLQVEHGVTEAITGVDVVQAQIRVAAGERLPWAQEEIRVRGHAVECRIYAEDPNTFRPGPGRITRYQEPAGDGVRVDSGVAEGSELSVYYDPLIAKVITWAEDRPRAIARMVGALQEFVVEGVQTNMPLHLRLLRHADFVSGDYHTSFIATTQDNPCQNNRVLKPRSPP